MRKGCLLLKDLSSPLAVQFQLASKYSTSLFLLTSLAKVAFSLRINQYAVYLFTNKLVFHKHSAKPSTGVHNSYHCSLIYAYNFLCFEDLIGVVEAVWNKLRLE